MAKRYKKIISKTVLKGIEYTILKNGARGLYRILIHTSNACSDAEQILKKGKKYSSMRWWNKMRMQLYDLSKEALSVSLKE